MCVVCISTCFATLLTASDWVSCVPWFCLFLFLILYIVGGLLASVLSLLFLFFWVSLAVHGFLFYVRFFFGDKLHIFLFWLPLFAGECCHLLFFMRVTPWFSVTIKLFSFNFVVTLFFFLPLFLNLHLGSNSFPFKFVSTLKVTLLILCWCETDFKVQLLLMTVSSFHSKHGNHCKRSCDVHTSTLSRCCRTGIYVHHSNIAPTERIGNSEVLCSV